MIWAQTKQCWAQLSENIMFCLICLLLVWISDKNFLQKTEQKRLVFGQMPETKPSGTGPEVERPRTELVQISDVDCISLVFRGKFFRL